MTVLLHKENEPKIEDLETGNVVADVEKLPLLGPGKVEILYKNHNETNHVQLSPPKTFVALPPSSLHVDAPSSPSSGGSIKAHTEHIKKERLESLDVFRGMTVVAMIVVDYGGGLWSGLNHSPWDDVTFADFVVPAFLFIVGVSLALAYKSVNDKRSALWAITLRFLKLVGLGLFLQGGYLHGIRDLNFGVDIQHLRIMGILQRIAIAYAVVALCEVYRSKEYIPRANESLVGIIRMYYSQWVTALLVMLIYLGLVYGTYVPSWEFQAPAEFGIARNKTYVVECNTRGSLSPGCNAVGYIDRTIMGISHLYQRPPYRRTRECSENFPYSGPSPADAPNWCMAPFDPEGLISSLPAIITCFIGAHYGHILLHMKGNKRRLWQWSMSGVVLMIGGLLSDFLGMPLNKQLYSFSYTLMTGGTVALAFTAVFVLVDILKWRSYMYVFKLIGAHSLMIYALFACDVVPIALHGIYYGSPDNNLIQIILKGLGIL